MNSHELVRKYFDREAERFDAIYEARKPLAQRLVDRVFRGVVLERFQLITNLAPMTGPWTVLDVGCGSGRYALAMSEAGAARVVGVDASAAMIELAGRQAAASGVSDRCEFHTVPFLEYETDERFDVVVATGYFDYLDEPVPHLRRMVERCRGRILASVPKRFEFRAPTRKLRFALAGGYVRFYGRREFAEVARAAGVRPERLSLIDLGRDWVAVIRT